MMEMKKRNDLPTGKATCANRECVSFRADEPSGCSVFSGYAVDICKDYEAPSAIAKLEAENRLLRNMNRNLIKTGHELARCNRMLRGALL